MLPDELQALLSSVASAVSLEEGAAGVRTVLRSLQRSEPTSVRDVSRAARLPVPIVSAICNELRTAGVVSTQRPLQLTEAGRAALGELFPHAVDSVCECCGGRGLRVPPGLEPVLERLEGIAADVPGAQVELDQTHCTAATKLLRALMLETTGALGAGPLLFLGDDDMTSVAVAELLRHRGHDRELDIVVVDIDARLTGFVEQRLAATPVRVRTLVHDLRRALPDDLVASAATVFTDPPYTEAGARLFLSRAVDAIVKEPGHDIFFCFGAKSPAVALGTQAAIIQCGLSIAQLTPRFNEYAGAGVLGGTSDLLRLTTTPALQPLYAGTVDGAIYTGEQQQRGRRYACVRCGRLEAVGRRERWPTVHDLKAAGCPDCGGDRFRPGSLLPAGDE